MPYQYKMVQIPPSISIRGAERGTEAALYLETLANEQAKEGWEFQRIDAVSVDIKPGCLGALFGRRVTHTNCYVVTFRKQTEHPQISIS